MTKGTPAAQWQDIGWNSIILQLPASWQPTVIYPSYLFFEEKGQAVFEIKWQQIRGKFSSKKNLAGIKGALKNGELNTWEIPPDFQNLLASYTVSGFQLQHENGSSHGMLIYCSTCKRVTLVQWYFDPENEKKILKHILASFRDHSEEADQAWSVFDIKTLLPIEAELLSHEFLPGRYTLNFELGTTSVTLYRFKPAAVLLQKKNIGEFGTALINKEPLEVENNRASWHYRAKGLERLLTKTRKQPACQWMRLWHNQEQNVILGVKAEGKCFTETGWLEKICDNYISIESK
jgi:hypothetical protein